MSELEGKLFAVAEGYPELRSAEVFTELQHGTETRKSICRRRADFTTPSVTSYNTAIAMFPAKLIAGSRQPKEFFAADESKREDVKMSF